MTDASKPEKVAAKCPHCGKMFRVAAAHVGKRARCPGCDRHFEIRAAQAPAARPRADGAASGGLCPVCQSPIGPQDQTTACSDCRTASHRGCWEYNGGCGMYGCSQAPETEHLDTLEIPAAHWGQDEKACPVCRRTILAAAIRCRYCGSTFASAEPENAATYQARAAAELAQPALRRTGIWLLVLGIVPCTAPVAAILGLLWYARRRREIDTLPTLHNAMCKFGVGVAVGQTALMLVLTVLYGLCQG